MVGTDISDYYSLDLTEEIYRAMSGAAEGRCVCTCLCIGVDVCSPAVCNGYVHLNCRRVEEVNLLQRIITGLIEVSSGAGIVPAEVRAVAAISYLSLRIVQVSFVARRTHHSHYTLQPPSA